MKMKTIAFVGSLGTGIAAMATAAAAQVAEIPGRTAPFYYGHDMMWGGGQWGGFGMVLGPIFMILILVAIIAGVIYVLRLVGGLGLVGGGHPAHDRALAILKERFAKGEIDSKEFEERKKLLAD
jgi:putative membrane protein